MGLIFSKLLKFSGTSYIDNFGQLLYNCDYPSCHKKGKLHSLYETFNSEDLNEDGERKKYCYNHFFQCNECGLSYGIQDSVYQDADEENYCKTCFHKIKIECPACWKTVVPTEMVKTVDGDPVCEKCGIKCETCDNRYKDYPELTYGYDKYGDYVRICEDCYRDKNFADNEFECHRCEERLPNYQFGREIEENGNKEKLCDDCGSVKCTKCKKIISAKNYDDEIVNLYGLIYCKNCYVLQRNVPKEFENEPGFDITSENIYFEKLKKIVPITAATLKQKYPEIFYHVYDLVKFVSGGKITKESIEEFKKFKVEFSGWGHTLQRSLYQSKENQLVLNVVYNGNIKEESRQVLEEINQYYYEKGHPYKSDQLGWVRMELGTKKASDQLDLFEQPIEKEEKFILVEEVQSDVDKFLFLCKNKEYDDEDDDKEKSSFEKIKSKITPKIFAELKRLTAQFPDSAMQSILNFAKKYNYKVLYFHTYENKVNLQDTNPPKSYYTILPQRYNFKPSEDKPFDLPGNYLKRIAALRKVFSKYK